MYRSEDEVAFETSAKNLLRRLKSKNESIIMSDVQQIDKEGRDQGEILDFTNNRQFDR